MAEDTTRDEFGAFTDEVLKMPRHSFLYGLRGMPEPNPDRHYDRMARQLRNAVERINDEAELERYIADLKLTRQDVSLMLACVAAHAHYFAELSRLTENYLKALTPPVQTCDMYGLLIFRHPRDARAGIADLEDEGLTAFIREDMVDPCDDRTTWVEVRGARELDDDGFFHWLAELTDGDVEEAGYADNGPKVAGLGGNVVPLGAGPAEG